MTVQCDCMQSKSMDYLPSWLKFVQLVVELRTCLKKKSPIQIVIRHVLPSNPSMQLRRQEESQLMEHLC